MIIERMKALTGKKLWPWPIRSRSFNKRLDKIGSIVFISHDFWGGRDTKPVSHGSHVFPLPRLVLHGRQMRYHGNSDSSQKHVCEALSSLPS